MAENIFVGIMAVIAVAAGVWAWWLERGSSMKKDVSNETMNTEGKDVTDNKEKNRE